MKGYLSPQELLACLKAGWRLRYVMREISGRYEMNVAYRDIESDVRDLWLDRFCDDDHPDLDIEGAAQSLHRSDAIRLIEWDDHSIAQYVLTETAPPHALAFDQLVAEEVIQ